MELQDCLFKGMVEIESYAMAIICNIAKESTIVELDGASGYQSIVGGQGSVAKLILGQQDIVDLLYQIGAAQSTEQPLSFLDDTERQAFLDKHKRS